MTEKRNRYCREYPLQLFDYVSDIISLNLGLRRAILHLSDYVFFQ